MKDNDEYYIFKGAKLDRRNAKKVGVGILFGIMGIIFVFILPIQQKSFISYLIILCFVLFGYFFIGPKVEKANKSKSQDDPF